MLSGQSKGGRFSLEVKDIRHNIFENHIQINDAGRPCAYLSYTPKSGILPPDSSHLKLDNKYLYQSDLRAFVDLLLVELKLDFKSVSRLDIALDLVKFHRISCPQFIKNFLSEQYLKRYACSFHLDGKAIRGKPIHYIRFGSKESHLQWYLYNKSKELREKTDKPYIRDQWELNGLPAKSRDIWRLEFSLKPSQFGVVESGSGEVIEFNNLDCLNADFLKRLFITLFRKECDFRMNDGQKRKDRMKKVELLRLEDCETVYKKVSNKLTSNRMDKVFIKKLYQLNQAWREQNRLKNDDLNFSDLLLADYVDDRGLVDWYNRAVIQDVGHKITEEFTGYSTAYYYWKHHQQDEYKKMKGKIRFSQLKAIVEKQKLQPKN